MERERRLFLWAIKTLPWPVMARGSFPGCALDVVFSQQCLKFPGVGLTVAFEVQRLDGCVLSDVLPPALREDGTALDVLRLS